MSKVCAPARGRSGAELLVVTDLGEPALFFHRPWVTLEGNFLLVSVSVLIY